MESNKCVFLPDKLKNSYHILKPGIIDNMSGPIGRKKKKEIYEFLFDYFACLLTPQKDFGRI